MLAVDESVVLQPSTCAEVGQVEYGLIKFSLSVWVRRFIDKACIAVLTSSYTRLVFCF